MNGCFSTIFSPLLISHCVCSTSVADGEMVDGDVKSDSSPEREATAEDDSKDTDPSKKRKRKPYRPGKSIIATKACNMSAFI